MMLTRRASSAEARQKQFDTVVWGSKGEIVKNIVLEPKFLDFSLKCGS